MTLTVPEEVLRARLVATGFLDRLDASMPDYLFAVERYKTFHDLAGDEWMTHILVRRFCGHPDVSPIASDTMKWPQRDLTWAIDFKDCPVEKDLAISAVTWAFTQWAQVCAVRPRPILDLVNANILITFGTIDRKGGILAFSELADGSMRQKRQRYDVYEAWVFDENPPMDKVDLGRVVAHELGHVLGIYHLPTGTLMQPLYDRLIRTPRGQDITEAVDRYGIGLRLD